MANKQLIVMPVHGMGNTPSDYDKKLKRAVRKRLDNSQWNTVDWRPVYYQDVFQPNQQRLLDAMHEAAQLDWKKLREFLLFGFSDAAGMGYKPHEPNSAYAQIQQRIFATLDAAYTEHGTSLPIVLIAHSLGGHVVSSYIWDAQQTKPNAGVFRHDLPEPVGKHTTRDQFMRFKSLSSFVTTGCNIPIFIAGIPKAQIKPILVNGRGWNISWENYYDKDDVLGWPLQPICPNYRKVVAVDKQTNVSSNLGNWMTSGTPISHSAYWRDRRIVKRVADIAAEFV
jgi:hypothetical protein